MKKINFCEDWNFAPKGRDFEPVTLPHDAQIRELRTPDASDSGHGFFPGGVYIYEKRFTPPEEWQNQEVFIEFEGVYRNCTVSLNGQEIGGHRYGYTNFLLPLDLRIGEENVLTVTADNSELPNSRWYTGSGIYRPVWLYLGRKEHIAWQGVKITTLSVKPAAIRVQTEVTGGDVCVEILNENTVCAKGEGTDCRLELPGAKLWSDKSPFLYTCRVTLFKDGRKVDETKEQFGVRKLRWSSRGLFINGRSVKLRGGCVHHDNGILGAATYDESERRRVRIMKEAGFNAIRSAHNPTSRAMLEACDYYGMYLMDESFDMWYNRKNKYDYGLDYEECWQEDVTAMVTRDYNHPSVILYSIGNEVAEPAQQKGIELGRAQADLIRSLDPTRPTTIGLNLMILNMAAKGKGLYQDGELSQGKEQTADGNQNSGASQAFNLIASHMGTLMNKSGNSKKVDALATPIIEAVDIVGYNYGSGRYPLDGKQHPERIVFGSETFPQDICKNWMMVMKYPYVLGDFMWTAWDYLGETGIGAWSYEGGMPFNRPYPWLLAGAGVIDICGNPDASCRYAATIWKRQDNPVIGVRPVNHPGVKVSRSMWRATNAVESWAWQGCSGNKAEVEVYARAAYVELWLNDRRVGRKKTRNCKAMFKLKYAPGTLTAVAFSPDGTELSRSSLRSAAYDLHIAVEPEHETADPGQIVYVPVSLKDEDGIVEFNADRKLKVSVDGGELLAFGAANPKTEEQYHTGSFTSYLGRALAVVRVNGKTTVTVTDGTLTGSATIRLK